MHEYIQIETDLTEKELHGLINTRARLGGIVNWYIERINNDMLELKVEHEGLDIHDMMCNVAHTALQRDYGGAMIKQREFSFRCVGWYSVFEGKDVE